ncbi:hypothetical protein BKA67DRAFT_550365 [Truncatella angustata]|uniref:Secreted protein n=1 Tax=Truncatella angustata TaxID=152316 RepID=A0A9P8UZD2_9PEZI|nr:uncharacterized protein BKA67DRAFT_550365 [Truncatella angustata]KAH6661167.1 hypothetical protein BKA67DRAFT_550365 [Truncatella angustata]
MRHCSDGHLFFVTSLMLFLMKRSLSACIKVEMIIRYGYSSPALSQVVDPLVKTPPWHIRSEMILRCGKTSLGNLQHFEL